MVRRHGHETGIHVWTPLLRAPKPTPPHPSPLPGCSGRGALFLADVPQDGRAAGGARGLGARELSDTAHGSQSGQMGSEGRGDWVWTVLLRAAAAANGRLGHTPAVGRVWHRGPRGTSAPSAVQAVGGRLTGRRGPGSLGTWPWRHPDSAPLRWGTSHCGSKTPVSETATVTSGGGISSPSRRDVRSGARVHCPLAGPVCGVCAVITSQQSSVLHSLSRAVTPLSILRS